jgi:hypothetical protein
MDDLERARPAAPGVANWISHWRITVESMSAPPTTISMASDRPVLRENPKAIVAMP